MTAPGTAYEAAVEAMALALEETNDGGYAVGWDTLARAVLAALVASEDVRAALENSECLLHPGQGKCGGAVRGSNVRFHLPCFLAALSPGGATQPTTEGTP